MAQEIRLKAKYANRGGGRRRGKGSGTSGTARPRMTLRPGEKEAAMALTAANQRVLVLEGGRHRRMVRASELRSR